MIPIEDALQWGRALLSAEWSLYVVAVIFSPEPGEKGAAAAPQRGSFVSAPAKARD